MRQGKAYSPARRVLIQQHYEGGHSQRHSADEWLSVAESDASVLGWGGGEKDSDLSGDLIRGCCHTAMPGEGSLRMMMPLRRHLKGWNLVFQAPNHCRVDAEEHQAPNWRD